MGIRLSPLAHDKNILKNTLHKLHLKNSIISHTRLKVSFHNNYYTSLIVYKDVLIFKK